MKTRLFLCAVLSVVCCSAHAALVTLSGKAPDYAGKSIVVRTFSDYVSRLRVDLLTIVVDQQGNFASEADIGEVTYAFMDLGTYEGYIYLEPGARYEIVLPPFSPRSDADRFNPFYTPQIVEIGLRGASSPLNQAIRDFDRFFNRELARAARRMVRTHDTDLATKLVARTDSLARAIACDKQYFRNHVRYRQAQITAAPRLNSGGSVLRDYFIGRPVLWNLPAYWDVLDMMQPDPTISLPKAELRKQLSQELASKTPSMARLSSIVGQDPLWHSDQNLREALILRSFQRQFYQQNITDGRADTLLISAARECHTDRNRLIAANIYAKKNKLKRGLPAPELHLFDVDDHPIEISTFRGKFLYLCFMHTDNYECLKALPALENLRQLHKDDLDVLCILTNEHPEQAFKMLADKRYTWLAVSFIPNQRLVFDYEVKALPTYFLIDPEGNIAMAQAPGPAEKVGPAIHACIRNYQIEKLRGKPEVPRTIYDIAREAH